VYWLSADDDNEGNGSDDGRTNPVKRLLCVPVIASTNNPVADIPMPIVEFVRFFSLEKTWRNGTGFILGSA
jgi:hypothetical protein